jgi:hypothetical protein
MKKAIDFKVFSIKSAFLGKTCEMFRRSDESPKNDDFIKKIKFENKLNEGKRKGLTRKQVLEWDIQSAIYENKRQNRLESKKIDVCSDFDVLRDMQHFQNAKKQIDIKNLEILDFNGTDKLKRDDFKGLKVSDIEYMDFEQVRAIDNKTGEIYIFDAKGKGNNRKYILKSYRNQLDDRLSLQRVMQKLLPEFRVSKCLCCVQDKHKPLTVFKSAAHGSVSVSNLQTCGSVWHDPFCAAKITEKRRKELNQAVEKHKENGGSISLVTRTIPHTKKDSLLSLRDRFRLADKYMKKHRQFKKMRGAFGVFGDVKAFEITATWQNGWHLHVHEVYFHNAGAFDGEALANNSSYSAFLANFQNTYSDIWIDSALKAGFDAPSKAHGLTVQNGDFAAEYIAKWGHEPESTWDASAELTKGHIKNSKKGFTPFELMRLYRDTGDERLVPILREYAHTMHGQQQLIWSKGLKQAFGIGEKSDEELSDELDDLAEELGILSPVQWKYIIKRDLRSEFFYFASESWDVVTNFLYSFPDFPVFSMIPVDDFD